ncbi:MAG: hypothetical protein ACJAR0_003702 [Candidatus Azotimanducaceae bacterium]|jgi:hypothetical protein
MRPLDLATARRILDFSGGDPSMKNLGELQLKGTVAIHNMIADPSIGMGYLADEVGMGKTYVALGVVALMRYFNPALRVLYICPSNNVQDKWYNREYRSFTQNNVVVSQYRIRTLDGKPAAPRISCRNVSELIHNASLGYYADFFVGMNAFSMSLSDDDEAQWDRKLDELRAQLPAYNFDGKVTKKMQVKDQFALALNYTLPTFDLVIIDEAHKFKHDFDSSDRNRVLSAVLGFRDESGFTPRVKNALLLSATPFDRNFGQLRNQLNLVGKGHLLPDDIYDDDANVKRHLSRFLVRRLNELTIAGKPHTRNMYRREWRSGVKAEIALQTDEQKLVTALVQKKVGEMLDKKGGNPSFQTGLLASFESYAETTKSNPVEFDGDKSEKKTQDARDRHAIGQIADSYSRSDLGRTLPHPKMDVVTAQVARHVLDNGRKQILFVRRVKSVKELKFKLDDHYTNWLAAHIRRELAQFQAPLAAMNNVIAAYLEASRERDDDISGGDFHTGTTGDAEDTQQAKNDNLFTWFFRGSPTDTAQTLLTDGQDAYTTPEAMRKGLGAKNQVISSLLEINWAAEFCRLLGEDLRSILAVHADDIAQRAAKYTTGALQNDLLEIFNACQLGFLEWLGHSRHLPALDTLIDHLAPRIEATRDIAISPVQVEENLQVVTLFDAMATAGLQPTLFPYLGNLLQSMLAGQQPDLQSLQKLDTHLSIVSVLLRTGHGAIDLYLARLKLGTTNLTAATRTRWAQLFVESLQQQSNASTFSTYHELANLAEQLDLVIKTNLPDVYDKTAEELRTYLSHMLNPVTPIIGASGETVNSRSAQARKFRMPGYPLVLISTDVFQEGEDLHTFCDSVIHYGLSGSPVSIEQKTGRVDRVASYAQRGLLNVDDAVDLTDDKFIQVTFPFVKESIELLQVRKLCVDINQFIESLHEIGTSETRVDDNNDLHAAMQDRSAIPAQIMLRLQSPYVPKVNNFSTVENREQLVEDQSAESTAIVTHITSLLKHKFGSDVLADEFAQLPGVRTKLNVNLRSARASGVMLLTAKTPEESLSTHAMQRTTLLNTMLKKSWQTFRRTSAVETAHRSFQLYSDAEMMIGDEHTTTVSEIDKFFERFTDEHNPAKYLKPTSPIVLKYWAQSSKKNPKDFGQLSAELICKEHKSYLEIEVRLGAQPLERRHKIQIFEANGRCIFLATAASAKKVKQLSVEQIIRFTWQRNALIDIVEFMLSDKAEIVGRAVHPIDGMTLKEFLYCAYTLATSTDRLEYLLQEPDLY